MARWRITNPTSNTAILRANGLILFHDAGMLNPTHSNYPPSGPFNQGGAIIAFGTGGLYAMFMMTTGVGLYARTTGRWNPMLGELKLDRWGLPINTITFHWSVFEFINIAWSRPYAVSPDAPWWQLWAVPLVLGSILGVTTLSMLIGTMRRSALPESSS